ncbi:MAG: two-component regulator propeller domain-containing protein, partial [Bacteroidota bacterium]
MKPVLCILGLVIGFVANSFAQYTNQIHFKNLSIKDGLSYPAVTCFLQDQKGFMWVGTNVGLNKYDSQKFK